MNVLKKILSALRNNIQLVFLILLGTTIGSVFPSTYWSFVDDGEMIEVAQRMQANLSLLYNGHILKWLEDPQMGRFRPVYWLFHFLVYSGFGINHSGHASVQILLLVFTVIAGYFTAKLITGNKTAGFLAGLFFIANTLNQENWYRLGPQEAPLTCLLSFSVLFVILYLSNAINIVDAKIDFKVVFKNWKVFVRAVFPTISQIKNTFYFRSRSEKLFFIASLILVVPAYFTKENSIVFVVFSTFLYLWVCLIKKQLSENIKGKLFFYLVLNIALAILARLGAMRNYIVGSYASDYIITVDNIKSNFKFYSNSIWITFEPLIIIVGLFVIVKTIRFILDLKISSRSFFGLIFLAVFFAFFTIQLPWQFAIPRYLLPGMYFLAIFMGSSLGLIIEGLSNSKNNFYFKEIGIQKGGVFLKSVTPWLIAIVAGYNLIMMGQYITRIYMLTNEFNRPLISYLAQNTKANGTVVLDTPPGTALELKQEIGLHLRLFYNRGDVKVEYFNAISGLKAGDVLLRAGELKQVSINSDFSKNQLSSPKRIDIHLENKLYYPPMQFVKNYLVGWVYKVIRYSNYDFNPVLATSKDDYYWEMYKIATSK